MSGNYPWIMSGNYPRIMGGNYHLVYHHLVYHDDAEKLRFIGILAYPKMEDVQTCNAHLFLCQVF